MQHNWTSQSASAAQLVFPSVTYAPLSRTYPITSIPVYIQSGNIPVRKPKIDEVNTLLFNDGSGNQVGFQTAFYQPPDPLTWALSGWVVTPTTPVFGNTQTPTGANIGGVWRMLQPVDSIGTKLPGLLGTSYADLIIAYLEGRMSVDASGRGTRVDPTSFIDGYGNVYSNPKITSFVANYTVVPKKQTFNMTLWIEN